MTSMFQYGMRSAARVVRTGRCLAARSAAASVVCVASAASAAVAWVSSPASATVVYVDASAPPGGSGASWSASIRFLRDALDEAGAPGSTVTEVRVAQGRYVPDRSEATPNGTGDREASFRIPSGVVLRGGYGGLAYGNPDAWDPLTFETILDGDLLGDDASGGSIAENAYTIVTAIGTAPPTTLEGVVVRGGVADGPMPDGEEDETPWRRRGAGIWVTDGSLRVARSRLTGNLAVRSGSAIGGVASTLEVVDCMFERNGQHVVGGHPHSETAGGAIGMDDSSVDCSDTLFLSNRAIGNGGGAISMEGGSCRLRGTVLQDNTSGVGGSIRIRNVELFEVLDHCVFSDCFAGAGGAIHAVDTAAFRIQDSSFVRNSASSGSAVISIDHGLFRVERSDFIMHMSDVAGAVVGGVTDNPGAQIYMEFQDCRFILNETGHMGGAIAADRLRIVNCLFSRNHADTWGSALYVDRILQATNCAFSDHKSPTVHAVVGSSYIRNCIIWGATGGYSLYASTSLTVRDSIIQGGWNGPGSGVLNVDPRFRSPGTDDLRLLADSPALNAGGNQWVPPDLLYDLDGLPRIQEGIVDMGCFEGPADPAPPAVSIPHLSPGQAFGVVLGGGIFDPWTKATLIVQNVSSHPTGATVLTQLPAGGAPGGFSLPQGRVCLESSLLPGQMKARITVPFMLADLNGEVPSAADLAVDHPVLNRWVRAVLGNVSGPHGTRFVTLNGQTPPMPFEVGNFGVAWDPVLERGYVIAIVDRTGDFAMGLPSCPGDVALMPDGSVSMPDALFVLSNMGAGYGFADVNHDGVVDVLDLTQVLSGWGSCPDD